MGVAAAAGIAGPTGALRGRPLLLGCATVTCPEFPCLDVSCPTPSFSVCEPSCLALPPTSPGHKPSAAWLEVATGLSSSRCAAQRWPNLCHHPILYILDAAVCTHYDAACGCGQFEFRGAELILDLAYADAWLAAARQPAKDAARAAGGGIALKAASSANGASKHSRKGAWVGPPLTREQRQAWRARLEASHSWPDLLGELLDTWVRARVKAPLKACNLHLMGNQRACWMSPWPVCIPCHLGARGLCLFKTSSIVCDHGMASPCCIAYCWLMYATLSEQSKLSPGLHARNTGCPWGRAGRLVGHSAVE